MTIGELAERAGVRPSTLRYYERRGVLSPEGRSEAGYREYGEEAVRTVKLIRSAQGLGLQLAEIRQILSNAEGGAHNLKRLVEHRFIQIEKESARLAVQRHELRTLILDLEEQSSFEPPDVVSRLTSHVCSDQTGRTHLGGGFRWLAGRLDCGLADNQAGELIEALTGGHYHVWEYKNGYRVLAVSPTEAAAAALRRLVRLEADCAVHRAPGLTEHADGLMLDVTGDVAFLYASLFVSLDEGRS